MSKGKKKKKKIYIKPYTKDFLHLIFKVQL